jgi:hypothetical protein
MAPVIFPTTKIPARDTIDRLARAERDISTGCIDIQQCAEDVESITTLTEASKRLSKLREELDHAQNALLLRATVLTGRF